MKGYFCVYFLIVIEVLIVSLIIGFDCMFKIDFVVLGGMLGVGVKGVMSYGFIVVDLLMN